MNTNKINSRIAGILNLLIAVCAPFSIIFIPLKLINPKNAVETANNILASESLFRAGIGSSIAVHIFQILFALILFKLLKKYGKYSALLMLVFSLTGVSIALVNELNNLAVLGLLHNTEYLNAINIGQLQSQVMFFLYLHSQGILLAQIFWGLWLFPLGYLILKSCEIPKIIGILIIIAGLGYFIDSFCKLSVLNYNITISSFTFIGEVVFTLWLLIVGLKNQVDSER